MHQKRQLINIFKKQERPLTGVQRMASEADDSFVSTECKLLRSQSMNCFQPSPNKCCKCHFLRKIWMVVVNLYDFMGLLDICPCGTLHPIAPYIESN